MAAQHSSLNARALAAGRALYQMDLLTDDLIVFLGLQNVDPKEFQPSNGRASSKG